MRDLATICYISAERANLGERENLQRTAELEDNLIEANLSFENVYGQFEGVTEAAFAVTVKDSVDLKVLFEFAQQFDQDCILVLEQAKGTGYFRFKNGGRQNINGYKYSGEKPAGDYTYNPLRDQYLSVV